MIEAIASSLNSSNLNKKNHFAKMNESKTQEKTNYVDDVVNLVNRIRGNL